MKVILGGGITGLSAAHYLYKRFPSEKIVLYEGSHRTGGWIKTFTLLNGVRFEQGPRTIRPRGLPGLNTLELIKSLDLLNEIVPIKKTEPAAKNRMIYVNKKLHLLPSELRDIMRTVTPFKKPLLYYLLNDLTAEKKISEKNDESIYDFVERRFGKDIADYAISPMICGICAGDAKEISVKFLMESLYEKEQKHGSITKGLLADLFKRKNKNEFSKELSEMAKDWSIYSFKDGLETLPKMLVKDITRKGINLQLGYQCNELKFYNDEVIMNINGKTEYAKHVISSLPSNRLAKLVQLQHPKLADLLKKIPYVTVGVVNLHYNKKLPLHDAFGFLIPPSENLPILGVIYDSCCFHTEDTILTIMMGGKWFDKYFSKNKDILPVALEQLKDILNITEPPTTSRVNILNDCIPQYVVGHKNTVQSIENYIKAHRLPLSICGSSYYGVGVNDVILSAKNAVMAL